MTKNWLKTLISAYHAILAQMELPFCVPVLVRLQPLRVARH